MEKRPDKEYTAVNSTLRLMGQGRVRLTASMGAVFIQVVDGVVPGRCSYAAAAAMNSKLL